MRSEYPILAIIAVLLGVVLFWPEKAVQCFSKPDGSVYCYASDGHLYRLRADKFRVIVQN